MQSLKTKRCALISQNTIKELKEELDGLELSIYQISRNGFPKTGQAVRYWVLVDKAKALQECLVYLNGINNNNTNI